MRAKFYNKDIASQLANDISVTNPKDELHLSSFIDMPIEIKTSMIEDIANAQIDYIKEGIDKEVHILHMPYIGTFKYATNREIAQTLFTETSLEIFNKEYKNLTLEEKNLIKSTCKPKITDRIIENNNSIKGRPLKNRNNVIKVSSFIKKDLL